MFRICRVFLSLVALFVFSGPVSASPDVDFPVSGQSYGGKVRAGPGTNFRQIGSTREGQRITIIRRMNTYDQGFDWFEIRYANGRRGYQSGGLMCADQITPGTLQTCGDPNGPMTRAQAPTYSPQAPSGGGGSSPTGVPQPGIIYYPGGELQYNENIGPNMWQEVQNGRVVATFRETGSSRGIYFFFDSSRDLELEVNLRQRNISWRQGNGAWNYLYPITDVFYPDPAPND